MNNPQQPHLQPYKPRYDYKDNLDGQGRIRTDEAGNIIPPKQRVGYKDFYKNPYGHIGAGNAINPISPDVPNFLQAYGGAVANPYNPITSILGGGMPQVRGAAGW